MARSRASRRGQALHQPQRQGAVFQHGQVREQVELLEHHAHPRADRLHAPSARGSA